MGWNLDGSIINDDDRNVKLAFLKDSKTMQTIELVSPINEKSPVSKTLYSMKDVSTLYHICYEVDDISKAISILKKRGYVLTTPVKPAIAFNQRRVAFLVSKAGGLVELLEKESV